jgi:MinD-like ATPase involved in chromosome partitioning or flagellar assembly
MTDLDQQFAPPPAVRRLPGADRARAYTEPPRRRVTRPVETPPVETDVAPEPAPVTAPVPARERFAEPADVRPAPEWVPPEPREAPAEWGARRVLVRVLSFGLVQPKPGQEELAHRQNVRLIRQAVWPRSVRIAVANPKGAAGKTPTALVLGGTLARIRGGSVAIWDASDAAGTLAARAEGAATRCVSEIAADPAAYDLPSTVALAASTQSSFADVLGSLREREFDGEDIRRVSEVLDRTYRISVADTANTPHSSAFEAVIERADILVVPTTLTADSVNKALALLRRLQDTPSGLAQRAVVAILRSGGPETPGLAPQVPALFNAAGVGAIVEIPFDRHIATGTAITLANLAPESLVAWTRLAATTVANITTPKGI